MHVCYITVKSHFCLLCQMKETGSKHLCCPGYFQTPSECLHMYKGSVCSSSLDVFVRHLWAQEGALSQPCSQGASALSCRNALFGGLFQCFSLWAALLRLKRTEQRRSSTLRVFFCALSTPKVQRHKDSIRSQQLLYPIQIFSGCNPSESASPSAEFHPRGDCSWSKEEQNLSIEWMVSCMQTMIRVSCVRRG